ncbi:2Fe-2S iron-sulfur cluster-binding protein [Corallincola spongiicola]|uniref:2Fe-2S iron-sulfur cluster-binding protein n=1 Tax=Corallincola spongiicola TaxID=2520508 RepID=UPI001A914704|nr:2Fe-2S iron-sulfur cluster-binding protein [Corallincola spongiicola]
MSQVFQVQVNDGEYEFTVDGDETLLQAALAAPVPWPHRCRQGGCGSCLCRVTSGTVCYPRMAPMLTVAEQQEGWCYACLATPTSDLTIEIG